MHQYLIENHVFNFSFHSFPIFTLWKFIQNGHCYSLRSRFSTTPLCCSSCKQIVLSIIHYYYMILKSIQSLLSIHLNLSLSLHIIFQHWNFMCAYILIYIFPLFNLMLFFFNIEHINEHLSIQWKWNSFLIGNWCKPNLCARLFASSVPNKICRTDWVNSFR